MPLDTKDSEPKPKWIGEGTQWDADAKHWSCPKGYSFSTSWSSDPDSPIVLACIHDIVPHHTIQVGAGSDE
jgi:hypothetical protein